MVNVSFWVFRYRTLPQFSALMLKLCTNVTWLHNGTERDIFHLAHFYHCGKSPSLADLYFWTFICIYVVFQFGYRSTIWEFVISEGLIVRGFDNLVLTLTLVQSLTLTLTLTQGLSIVRTWQSDYQILRLTDPRIISALPFSSDCIPTPTHYICCCHCWLVFI